MLQWILSTQLKLLIFKWGVKKFLHNVDANYSSNIEEIKSKLVEQLYKPVLWTSIVQKMKGSGVEKLLRLVLEKYWLD